MAKVAALDSAVCLQKLLLHKNFEISAASNETLIQPEPATEITELPNEIENESITPMSLDALLNDEIANVAPNDLEKVENSDNDDGDDWSVISDDDRSTVESDSEAGQSDFESDESDMELDNADNDEPIEFDVSEMVQPPDSFYNDVFDESKTNRMLLDFSNFENTKKDLAQMMTPVPPLDEMLKNSVAVPKNPRHRNLDEDLDAALKTDNDFFALPKKLNLDSLTFEANKMLESDSPILASNEQQMLYQKSYQGIMEGFGMLKIDNTAAYHDIENVEFDADFSASSTPKVQKTNPSFFVQDEIAAFPDLTNDSDINSEINISEALSAEIDASVRDPVNLDHDYLKRSAPDHDIIDEASEPKKLKSSGLNQGI